MTKETFTISKKQIFLALLLFIGCGGILRFMLAYDNVHYFDLPYYITWAEDVFNNGIFGAYSSMKGMTFGIDYPPIFLFPLYITGAILQIPAVAACEGYLMLAIKMWQMLFDLAIAVALFFIFRKSGAIHALGAAALWCANPAMLFNSAVWGQTDSLLLFLLLVTFGAFHHKRPMLGTVLYAVACLTKFQAAYFAPIVLLLLFFSNYTFITILKSILAAMVTVVVVFLPFMLHSGAALPLEIYFGGLGKWPYGALYSFNFMGGLGLNYVKDSIPIFFSISANTFGSILTIAAVIGTVILFFTAKRRCPFVLGFLLMNTIFMFASRMHERYQLPVLILILAAAVIHKNGRLLLAYFLTTVMVFLNQYIAFEEIVYRDSAPAPWMASIEQILVGGSIVNVIVYLITLLICLDFLYDITGRIKTLYKPKEEEQQIATAKA